VTALFEPVDAAIVPRFAGVPSFMRLPFITDPALVDVALVGVPFDGGTTNRPGARHGPREIRNQSSLIRRINANGVSPYELLRVADLGDCPVNPIDLLDALAKIEIFFAAIAAAGAVPIAAGGDHLMTLPILRALAKDRPVGLVHFDSHSDTNDTYFGNNPFTHGSPFRRAVEEGLLDGARAVQIGIRGSYYHHTDLDFARAAGFRIITIDEVADRGIADVMAETISIIGDVPAYISFDIDSLDPSIAPGTGTPEIGGLASWQLQAILRRLRGTRFVGMDVVEVAPAYDMAEITALAGATVVWEYLSLVGGAA
jgi:guanidinopropionase